ncbi:MAG TPA: hypothetical protein VFI31_00640 [Pirellulales bacterium]|nr:hypothetical protein [Pirellulales bacterium]
MRESQARFDVRQELLRAALDVQLNGPDALFDVALLSAAER